MHMNPEMLLLSGRSLKEKAWAIWCQKMQVHRQKGKLAPLRSGRGRSQAKLPMGAELLWDHDENALNYKVVKVQYKKLPCTFLKDGFWAGKMVQSVKSSPESNLKNPNLKKKNQLWWWALLMPLPPQLLASRDRNVSLDCVASLRTVRDTVSK